MGRKKVIIIILGLLFLILLGVLGFLFVKSKDLKINYKKEITVNVYDKLNNLESIKSIKNGKIITKRKNINTSSVGVKKINIRVKDFFNRESNISYKVNIVDKESPVIKFKDHIVTDFGVKVDLLKDVSASDNSKKDIKVEVSGKYDFNKSDKYNLEYVAKDDSGNEKREKFILEVKEKPVVVTNNNSNNTNSGNTSFTTSKGFSGVTRGGITYINGIMIANKTYSLPYNYNPGSLTGDTIAAMNRMFSDAKASGLNIYLASGFRSYTTQKIIYNNYVNVDGQANADTYSARPGHSEHQTGYAFDVNQINNSFDNTNEAIWLANNCYKYGFILRYPKGKTNETGYMYESWHFRYVGVDLASKLYNNGNWITLESYFGITSKYS